MRVPAVLLLILSLVACNRGNQNSNTEAVRQGVVQYLQAKGFEIPKAMSVKLTSVQINGNQADVTARITPASGPEAQGMSMNYHLEQKDAKWVVVGRAESGANPHGGGAMPPAAAGAPNPHEGMAPGAGGGSGKMPSPEELPPAKKR